MIFFSLKISALKLFHNYLSTFTQLFKTGYQQVEKTRERTGLGKKKKEVRFKVKALLQEINAHVFYMFQL